MSEEETLLEFPCQFPVKAMGKNIPDFDAIVVGIINQHVEYLKEGAIKTKLSKKGTYISVTIMVEATSKKQLDAIYQGLTDCSDILITL